MFKRSMRVISMVLVIALTAALVPAAVFAEDGDPAQEGGEQVTRQEFPLDVVPEEAAAPEPEPLAAPERPDTDMEEEAQIGAEPSDSEALPSPLTDDIEIKDNAEAVQNLPLLGSTSEHSELLGHGEPTVEAASAEGTCGTDVIWRLFDGVLTISGSGEMQNYSKSGNVPWNAYLSAIESVVISEGVKSIGTYAFYKCENMTSIMIPETVQTIGDYVFYGCSSIEKIDLPQSVNKIGKYTFYGCSNLEIVNFPKTVNSFESDSAFTNCSKLVSVVLPDGIKKIDNGMFYNCGKMQSVYLPEGITNIERYGFGNCNSLEEIKLPDTLEEIRDMAFMGCGSLREITIPDNVTILYNTYKASGGIFENCVSLEKATIGDGVKSLDNYLFKGCGNLKEIILPINLSTIGKSSFSGCKSLISVTIPESVTSIGDAAFSGCSGLTSVTIPDSVTSIGDAAFSGCDSLKTAGPIGGGYDYEFGWIGAIPDNMFYGCGGLTSVTIPESVTSIGNSAFYGCSDLTSVTIPRSVTSIGNNAFNGCSGLTSVTIPESVTSIGDAAFSGCDSLKTAGPIGGGYDYEFGWTGAIPDNMFYGCGGLTSVTIPDSVTGIGAYAFYDCSSLTNVNISDSVTGIGNYAFSKCTSLNHITIPDNVTEIGENIFSNCTGLESVYVGSGTNRINRRMFENCLNLSTVILNDNITSLENGSFYGCRNLKSISLPSKLKVIATSVFYDSGITSIVIPESVTNIGTGVFPNKSILYVYPGSAAESYAQNNGYKYEYVSGQKTSVNLHTEDGLQILTGYRIEWYSENSDTPISNENDLYAKEAEYYYAKIIFDESTAFKFRQPPMIKVPYGQKINVNIQSINSVVTEAVIIGENSNIPESLSVEIKETVGDHTRSRVVEPDDKGRLSFEIANVTTTVKVSAEGYYSVTKYPIVGSTDAAKIDLGEIILKQITNKKIYVNLTVMSAVTSADVPSSTKVNDFSGIEFSLYDENQKAYIDNYTVEYPYVVIEDNPNNDEITVSAKMQNTNEAAAKVVPTDKGYSYAEITLHENGKMTARNVLSDKRFMAFVFDKDGAMRQRIISDNYSFTSDSLSDGLYTVIFMEKNVIFNSFTNIEQIYTYGLQENRDYTKFDIPISAGSIFEIENVNVPKFNLNNFSHTVDNSTKVEVNKAEVTTGDYITVKIEYEIDPRYTSENEKILIETPESLSIANGSLTFDGENISYTRDDDGNIVIATNKSSGVIKFYVSASEEGSFQINAGLSFDDNGNHYIQSIGAAALYVAGMFINVPNVTATKEIHVSGSTRRNANIIIYDGKTEIGRTNANANGSWLCMVELNNCTKYSNHIISAVAEFSDGTTITSNKQNVFYDPDAPEVSKVTMYSRSGAVLYDFKNPTLIGSHYSYWYEYPEFTFTIEFINDIPADSNVYLNVYGNMDIISVKAEYAADKKLWMAKLDVEQGFLPVNVEVQVKGYNTIVDSNGDYISSYSYSVDDLNNIASANSEDLDISDSDFNKFEEIDPVYGICKIGDSIAAMENGYVSYSEDELNDLSMGLKNEKISLIELDDGAVVYLYTGIEDGLYVSQIISDCDTALKLSNIFDKEYVNLISNKNNYVAFTTVMLFGIPDDKIDEVRNLFVNLNNLSVSATEDSEDPDIAQAQNFGDDMWDIASEWSEKAYLASQKFIDMMQVFNLTMDAFDAKKGPDWDEAMCFMLDTERDMMITEIKDHIVQEMYNMYQNIDLNSPYFQEATDIINELENNLSVLNNLDIGVTTVEFLANLLDRTGKVKNVVGLLDKLKTTKEFADIGKYYRKMSNVMDKERRRKNNDNDNNYSENSSSRFKNSYSTNTGFGNTSEKYSGRDSAYCIDPSGYVCEAVPSNRLEGVTATAYYLDDVLDDFGEPTGEKTPCVWNALDYDQINPLITDANGEYAWDVPQGSWQVKYEKEGYETAYSEWLPVPPPQTEVNTAMVSKAAPEVTAVNAYKDGVKITFSKYMRIDTVNTNSVKLTSGGAEIAGTIAPIDAEASFDDPNVMYAKTFVFTPATELSGSVSARVSGAVSYSGTPMAEYAADSAVKAEPEELSVGESVGIGSGSTAEIGFVILPKEAAAGAKINVKSLSPNIVSAAAETATAGADGRGNITVNGVLPGSGDIVLEIEGTDISKTIRVNVAAISAGKFDKKLVPIEVSGAAAGHAIIAAAYDGNIMVGSATRTASGSGTDILNLECGANTKTAKIMEWESFDSLKPVKPAEERQIN